ncbi:MAG: hypothetical protein ACM3UU_06465 [Ignavibacteriales bacterium]
MKKSIKRISNVEEVTNLNNAKENNINEDENVEIVYVEASEGSSDSRSDETLNFSFSSIISYGFIILLILAVAYKFVFPTLDSAEANLTHKKIGKSIVSSYFNLLQNTKYSDALKLIDTSSSEYSVNSLVNDLKSEFGSTDIIGYDVMDVIDNNDSSVVNTIVSYIDSSGRVLKKDQSFLVKNTPDGWKISLNGLIKKFSLQPAAATISNSYIISLKEIEYCIEGINLKVNIQNQTYKKFNINGTICMNMNTGYSFSEPINSLLKPKVNYDHNILFNNSSGQPNEVILKLDGNNYTLPVTIIK